MIQINMGDSNLSNIIDQISNILLNHTPHIVVINELNNEYNDTVSRYSFPNYTLETDNLKIYKKSRTGILLHKYIHHKRCKDLETTDTSTIRVQLSHPGKKPILFQGIYCQFQRLGKENTSSISSQEWRWSQILSKWELAIQERK